ncbi:hypothetical protein BJ742DRAFT_849616 [Cladochytrium replicatum]|nr:hypothetical protein BJ742DRAFT_849616 [Cladochytrium replicatum]
MISKVFAFYILASAAVSAVPVTLSRRAPSFDEIDISRLGGDGTQAEENAGKVCPSTLSVAELEDIRQVAEAAEKNVFNTALKAPSDTDTKAAIQCQKDRNKVLKNHCQLVKAQIQNDAAQIAENTKQLNKNRGDVTSRCANVDASLFIGGSAANGGGNAGNNNGNAGNNSGDAGSNNGNAGGNTGAVTFADIDISRKGGDGTAASNNAKAVCPSSLSAKQLETIRSVAEDAESAIFNAAIAAASNKAAKDAIQCQKDRNKVLKNTCQLVKAQLQNDQAQITENTKQIAKNTADVTSRCANVNTALFVLPDGAAAGGGDAGAGNGAGNSAADDGADDGADDEADDDEDDGSNNNAGGAVTFANIDISRKAGDGTAASNNAKAVCPSTLAPNELEAIRRVAEDAESDIFNAAIAAASDKAAKAAIQCQKDRNKVLKNTCQLVKAQLQNDQAQIDENTKQIAKNTADVTKRCANVDTSKFVLSTGSASLVSSQAVTAKAVSAKAISFASIDISRRAGNGVQAEANAAKICPASLSAGQLEAIRQVAEAAEKDHFNPAIAAASDKATKAAIQCQKDRNKVLKNHCQLVKAQKQKDQAQIAENTKQLTKNRNDVTSRCGNVNTARFIAP